MDRPQLANKEKERPEGCDRGTDRAGSPWGNTALLGMQPHDHFNVQPWPCLAQGWRWQKLCHGGRAFFDTSGLQQWTVCCCDTASPRAGSQHGQREEKLLSSAILKKSTLSLAKSTTTLERTRRSGGLLLTRCSSAGSHQPAQSHALDKVLLPLCNAASVTH